MEGRYTYDKKWKKQMCFVRLQNTCKYEYVYKFKNHFVKFKVSSILSAFEEQFDGFDIRRVFYT